MNKKDLLSVFLLNDLLLVGLAVLGLTMFGAKPETKPVVPIANAQGYATPSARGFAQSPEPAHEVDRSKPFGETTFHTTMDACRTDDAHKRLDQESELWYESSYIGLDAHCLALLKIKWDYDRGVHYNFTTDAEWATSYYVRANEFALYVGAPKPFVGDDGGYTQRYRLWLDAWKKFRVVQFGGFYKP